MLDASTAVGAFLQATGARQLTPGGGSATALVGALAAAMGEMAINFSIGRKELSAFNGEQKICLQEMQRAREVLAELMVEDQLAYEAFAAARKLPDDEPRHQEKRDAALLICIRVPQAMAATGLAVLELCKRMVNIVSDRLLAELAVCADLAMATVRCATHNVHANLKEVAVEDRQSIAMATASVLDSATRVIQQVAPRIWQREKPFL